MRGLVDLFFVSVLLDAGAGDVWRFHESESDQTYSRSEGIAIASLHMFLNGDFATDKSSRKDIVEGEQFPQTLCKSGNLFVCKGAALQTLDAKNLYRGFQINEETNPLLAVDKRVELLRRLGGSLLKLPKIFGTNGRPGHLVGELDCTIMK